MVIEATANEYARQQNIIGSAILSYLPCMIVFDMCKDFHVSDGCLADSQRHSRVASVMPRE